MQRIDCYKEFIWNPSNRECEYGKSCDVRSIQTMKTVSAEKNWLIN